MAQPMNYMLNLPGPMQQLGQAINLTAGLEKLREARMSRKLTSALDEMLNTDLQTVSNNPTPRAIASLMVKYPQLAQQFKPAYEALSAEEQKVQLGQASNVYAALESGNLDVATRLLSQQAEAYRNSGLHQRAKMAEDMLKLIEISPATAKASIGLYLSSVMGPEKFTDTFAKLSSERREAELFIPKLQEQQAKARKALIEADYAESQQAAELARKGWDIYKLASDAAIDRENSRIAAINARLQREQNELKRRELELKLEAAKRKRDEEMRTKSSALEAARAGIDNSLSVIDRLLRNPELDNILGAVEGSRFYPSTLVGLISPFADADKRADALADIETIQSQAFLNNLMDAKAKGATFGALTEREGERLVNYVRSLKTRQSEQQFRRNLAEIQRLLLKSRQRLADKYGVPESVPDTPEAVPSPAEIQQLVDKYATGVK